MNWVELMQSILPGLVRTVGLLIAIVVPLSVAIELAKASGAFDRSQAKVGRGTHAVMHLLGMSDKAALPLAAGFVFGLAYGAGLILQAAEEGELSKRDRFLVVLFLIACHAVIEDTLIFVPLGVNPLFLFAFRFLFAVGLTALAARLLPSLRMSPLGPEGRVSGAPLESKSEERDAK